MLQGYKVPVPGLRVKGYPEIWYRWHIKPTQETMFGGASHYKSYMYGPYIWTRCLGLYTNTAELIGI